MEQFVIALDTYGQCFTYTRQKFLIISDTKLKQGVFDGPQVRTLFKDMNFITQMTEIEKEVWESFKAVATNFLGNNKRILPRVKSSMPCVYSTKWCLNTI